MLKGRACVPLTLQAAHARVPFSYFASSWADRMSRNGAYFMAAVTLLWEIPIGWKQWHFSRLWKRCPNFSGDTYNSKSYKNYEQICIFVGKVSKVTNTTFPKHNNKTRLCYNSSMIFLLRRFACAKTMKFTKSKTKCGQPVVFSIIYIGTVPNAWWCGGAWGVCSGGWFAIDFCKSLKKININK